MAETDHAERLARIETNLEHIVGKLEDLVSRAEFQPVKLITYGLAGGILTAFLTAVIMKTIGGV